MERSRRTIDTLLWSVFGGFPLACCYAICAFSLFILCKKERADQAIDLAIYFLWPFDSYLGIKTKTPAPPLIELNDHAVEDDNDDDAKSFVTVDMSEKEEKKPKPKQTVNYISVFNLARWQDMYKGALYFGPCFVLLCIPLHIILFLFYWALIVTIPCAKLSLQSVRLLCCNPSSVIIKPAPPVTAFGQNELIGMYIPNSCALHYFKYCAFDGFNVTAVNMLMIAFFVAPMAVGAWPHVAEENPLLVFFASLVAMIPLAYFVGLAIERLSDQSNAGMASFLNSFVGSIVDVIFTTSAVLSGNLVSLVKSTMIGSLLICLLLLPGISMIISGVKHRYIKSDITVPEINSISATVSSELLLLSAFGAFTPTLFYYSYGSYNLKCDHCVLNNDTQSFGCRHCISNEIYDSDIDDTYTEKIRPLTYVCSFLLPVVYVVSLFYTLRTHAEKVYGAPKRHEKVPGHIGSKWSKRKCFTVLICCVIVFGFVSTTLTNVLQQSAEIMGITQQFLGITIMAFAPSITEFISTIRFAFDGKLALSFEVSASYSVQIMLMQFPFLVAVAAIARAAGNADAKFTLLFEPVDVFCVIMSIFIVNFVTSHSAQTNYVEGALLCAVWAIVISAYWFSGL